MAIEVLAGSVIAHCGPRVCVAGRDLDVPQVHTRVDHGRDVRAGACGDRPNAGRSRGPTSGPTVALGRAGDQGFLQVSAGKSVAG